MATALCMRHEPFDTFGIAPSALRDAGLDPVVFQAWEAEREWPELADFDAFVVFGGSMSSLRDDVHPYLARERDMLAEALRLGMPTLGVCLGGQLLAQASGASVRLAPEPEVGFKPIALTAEGRGDPIASTFLDGTTAFEWHEDEFDLPDGATLLATGERGSVQAYRIGSAVGIQFHPEIDAEEIESWIQESGDDLTSKWGRRPDEFREETRREIAGHNERGRAFFRAFAREALSAPARRSA
jgi:GMP synthase (glutamine-hydrolysing)